MTEMRTTISVVAARVEAAQFDLQEECGPIGCDPVVTRVNTLVATDQALTRHAIEQAMQADGGLAVDAVRVEPLVTCAGRRLGPWGLGSMCGQEVSCELRSLREDSEPQPPTPPSPLV